MLVFLYRHYLSGKCGILWAVNKLKWVGLFLWICKMRPPTINFMKWFICNFWCQLLINWHNFICLSSSFHILIESNLSRDFYLLHDITTKILFNNRFLKLEKGHSEGCPGVEHWEVRYPKDHWMLWEIRFDGIVGETGENLISCSQKKICTLEFKSAVVWHNN